MIPTTSTWYRQHQRVHIGGNPLAPAFECISNLRNACTSGRQPVWLGTVSGEARSSSKSAIRRCADILTCPSGPSRDHSVTQKNDSGVSHIDAFNKCPGNHYLFIISMQVIPMIFTYYSCKDRKPSRAGSHHALTCLFYMYKLLSLHQITCKTKGVPS
jgi:hypothetical protein